MEVALLALVGMNTLLLAAFVYLQLRESRSYEPTTSVDVEETEVHAELPLSDFDKRIARFQQELNTPTYAENTAPTYHPGVINMPHDTVKDVPIKHAPEYAE